MICRVWKFSDLYMCMECCFDMRLKFLNSIMLSFAICWVLLCGPFTLNFDLHCVDVMLSSTWWILTVTWMSAAYLLSSLDFVFQIYINFSIYFFFLVYMSVTDCIVQHLPVQHLPCFKKNMWTSNIFLFSYLLHVKHFKLKFVLNFYFFSWFYISNWIFSNKAYNCISLGLTGLYGVCWPKNMSHDSL